MKTNEKRQIGGDRLRFLLRLQRLLQRSFWTPEPDEKRFLVGLPITVVLLLFLWKQGMPGPLGGYSVPVIIAVWCVAYVMRFSQRLRERGELMRVIIAPALYIALLLSLRFY